MVSLTPFTILFGVVLLVVALYAIVYALVLIFKHSPRRPFSSEFTFLTNSDDTKGSSEDQTINDLPFTREIGTADSTGIDLSVIVPCFNETKRLKLFLDDALPVLNSMADKTWELLLVDDGSTDGTAEYAITWAREQNLPPGTLRVCRLEKNRGKGGAVAHGMRHFRGYYAIFADADGASRFADVARLIAAIDDQPAHSPVVAIGSRAHMVKTDAVVNRSFIRNFLMYGLHTLVYIFGIRSIRDTQCGFKMFTRPAANLIFPYMHTEGWIFDVEILIIALRKKIPVLEVPISWHEVEGSKVELARDSIKMAIDLVVMRLAYIIGIYSDQKLKNE
ncbi:hypothetical protein DUD61_003650 [Geotrichum candidum]|nr:hypothetical protein DUD61_003650 [Geotrichum candidum]